MRRVRLPDLSSAATGQHEEPAHADAMPVLTGWMGDEPGRRLGWEIEQLADELTELFGRRVDLVSLRSLHPMLKPSVLALGPACLCSVTFSCSPR